MCKLNDRPEIDATYILALMNSESTQEKGKDIPVGEMLNEKYKPFTVRLVVSWFAVCFIYYGIMLLLPTILYRVFQDGGGEGERSTSSTSHQENFKYLFLIAISLVEVAGFYLATSIMDHPSIGRKKGVFYGLFTVGLASLLIFLLG